MQKTLSNRQIELAQQLNGDGFKLKSYNNENVAVFRKENTTFILTPKTVKHG